MYPRILTLPVLLAALLLAACDDTGVDAGNADTGIEDATSATDGHPCTGEAGTFSSQSIEVEGETRYYHLYVPSAYDCSTAWPLLMDLHGTASGTPRPEEAYGLAAAQAAAGREGFILLRPRSRFSGGPSGDIYRWDRNPGDPERNEVFLNALVEDLGQRYLLDTERLHAMGFSSGTNQVSVLMADADSRFSGYGHIGGGAWTVSSLPPLDARVFMATGFRDYMRTYHQWLVDMLDDVELPSSHRLVRDFDGGHELYPWMYDEMWPFLNRGERPAEG